MNFCEKTKGKRNKIRIGQKVRAKKSLIDWYAHRLYWLFGRVTDNEAYTKGEMEVSQQDLDKIYALTWAKLGNKTPSGVVAHYGCPDNDDGVDRKNLWVNFIFKTELGDIEYGTYIHEENVVALSKRKKK